MDASPITPTPPELLTEDYWSESTRPLVSLVFIAPMLVIYEIGVVSLGHQAVRNGADQWMREWLDLLGFSQYFLLPLLTCGILLGWHHLLRQRWRVPKHVIGGMWLESVVLALVLLVLAHWQSAWFGDRLLFIECSTKRAAGNNLFANLIAFLGAGIYEELLFRLMLLPSIIAALRAFHLTQKTSLIWGVIVCGLLFSLAHYRLDFHLLHWHITMTHGDHWNWFSFVFRFSAGVFFSLLFIFRGFGIAAGCHAIYDILAVLLTP